MHSVLHLLLCIYQEQLGLGEGMPSTDWVPFLFCLNLFCHIEFTKIIAAVSEHRNIADSLIRLINTAAYWTFSTVPQAEGMLWSLERRKKKLPSPIIVLWELHMNHTGLCFR